MDDDPDIHNLLVKTMGAAAVGIAAAEGFRFVFEYYIHSRMFLGSNYSVQINDFIHSTVSAFILILTGYEKAVLLWSGMRMAYFILTFVLCILFSTIFASSNPSPFFPLLKHWNKITQANKNSGKLKKNYSTSHFLYNMVAMYLSFAWPSIIGQCFGLYICIKWMKIYWDGWLTAHHLTYLPMLDECLPGLNTNTILGFLIETVVTVFCLYSFDLIDGIKMSHDGANKLLGSFGGKSALKSFVVILTMYFFLDVTGAFGNPFLALAIQRHCFDNSSTSISLIFVYVIGPFFGTIAYMIWSGKRILKKTKRSV